GIEPSDRVALVSENRYEWIVVDLAIQLARGVHVPIHPTLAGPQIAWQLRHCGCRLAFLSGPHQVAKLAPLEDELPAGMRWFTFDRCESSDAATLFSPLWPAAASSGTVAEGQRLEHAARRELEPSSLATIL